MKHSPGKLILAVCAACAAGVAVAAEAAVPISLPAEFRTQLTGATETVLYSEVVGEGFNTVSRSVIEMQCANARQFGLTTHTPIFEEGYDQPIKSVSLRISAAHASATLSTLYNYNCDSSSGRVEDPCACTYRVIARRRVYITKLQSGHTVRINADLRTGTATREIHRAGPPSNAEAGIERVKKLAPMVVGKDVIAGLPCVMRRQTFTPDSWIDRCIFEDPGHQWPPEMTFQALSETVFYVQNGETQQGNTSHTVKVVRDAVVDSGVFEMPQGMTVKDLK